MWAWYQRGVAWLWMMTIWMTWKQQLMVCSRTHILTHMYVHTHIHTHILASNYSKVFYELNHFNGVTLISILVSSVYSVPYLIVVCCCLLPNKVIVVPLILLECKFYSFCCCCIVQSHSQQTNELFCLFVFCFLLLFFEAHYSPLGEDNN